MVGHPKPPAKVRAPRPLKRSPPPQRKKRVKGSKYLSKEWRNLRARVLRRDKGWCRMCDQREATQVHHLEYGKGRGVKSLLVPITDLIAVCGPCHKAVHPWL